MSKKIKYTLVAMLVFGVVLQCGTIVSYAETICNGVMVDDVEIGGKTEEEANKIVNDYLEKLLENKLIIKANDKEQSSTFKELGVTYTEANYVEQALNIGKIGNVIRRYKDLKDVENDKKVYNVEAVFDDKKLESFVKDKATKCNIEPKEPSMSSTGRLSSDIGSSMSYKEGTTGKCIKEDELIKDIKAKVKKWNKKDIEVEAKVEETKPKHNVDELKECTTRIGSFSTNYGSSSSSRCNNIANATGKIDGSIIYPGDTFSILDKIAPFTSSNGYYEAGSYQQGKVVDSLGGGVCQVSTTLYNAVLRAELDVVMRNNHSMVVSYVPISADAMIASSASRDFKFKNNTKVPVYIEAYTSGRNVTFNIYGKETRPSSRTIKFQNKIIKTLQPGADVITKDSSKPSSYRKVTQSAHIGYKAEYYKIIYENGVEKERVKVNSSYYKAAPTYITVGTKQESIGNILDNFEDEDISEDDPPMSNKPGATKKPSTHKKATAKPSTNKPGATKKTTTTRKPAMVQSSVETNKPNN